MRVFSRLIALALATLFGATWSQAQDVAPVAENRLYLSAPSALGFSTQGQFSSFAPVASTASAGPGVERPASGTLRLRVSLLGAVFAPALPEFSIGDIIGIPVATFTDTQNRTVPLRREPVRRTEASFLYRLPNSNTVLTFTPGTTLLGERYFWSQHARFNTVTDSSGNFERVVAAADGGVARDGFVYASQAGGSRLYWRTEAPIAIDANSQAIYGLVERTVVTSSGSRLPVRRIFWTEEGFQGQPVLVPKGDIQLVRVAYSDTVPELVPLGQEFRPPGYSEGSVSAPLPRQTLWYDNQFNGLRAYNREGRVMVEFLGEIRNGAAALRRQVGIEIVDIIQEASPVLVQVPVGERLYPVQPGASNAQVYPLSSDPVLRTQALAQVDSQLASFEASQVVNINLNGTSFTGSFNVEGRTAIYAERATLTASDVQIFWQETGQAEIRWPRFLNRYHQYWPDELTDYAVNIRPSDSKQTPVTLPIFGEVTSFELKYQDDPTASQARINETTAFEVALTNADPVNRSLILFRTTNGGFWYVRVESVLDSYLVEPRYADFFANSDPATPETPGTGVPALVGQRLLPPAGAASVAGYVDVTQGDAFDPSAYINPFTAGIPAAEKGAILPVNASPRGSLAKDRLAVWWFRKLSPPPHLAGSIDPIYWPSYYTRYRLQWPVNGPRIVLASNSGSGDLPADAAAGSIYTQNDPSKPGYNPNEEHAQMITGRAYALRDDLNTPATTSAGYVLVRYTDGVDERPAIRTFRVFREDGPYTFNYDAKAGTVLQAPLPLAIMPLPLLSDGTSRNIEVTPLDADPALRVFTDLGERAYYNRFTFEDRKGLKWIYRGQHNPTETPPALGMKFYYPTQPGFAYPNATTGVDNAPAVGTLTPFLWDGVNGDRVTGTSITVNFKPYWPDLMPQVADRSEVPALQFAETLVKPKFGLPGLDGASSAKILYEQSLGRDIANGRPSAVLHDATRRKITLLSASGLPSLPASIATSTSQGRTYFQRLPAHLQQRFYFDPTLGTGIPARGGLVLVGEFKDEVVGESYLQPNILSAPDLAALQGLVANSDNLASAWRSAILNLSTVLETFVENPAVPGTYIPKTQASVPFNQHEPVIVTSDDQAVHSYALTAVGGGSGYVTLLLGNGRAFTDPSEPVQVHILRVGPADLYRGQVKPITAANPLAEDLTLQHTGDFGGRVQDFEFEWYYSPPVDGQPPQNLPLTAGTAWFLNPADGPRLALGGTQPLLTLTDNYYVMRYRPKVGHFLRPNVNTWNDTQGWSQWTAPALAEGWIKRVLAGINPYNQRLSDFFNNAINTDVSIITQAGKRWEGDIPLTLESAQEAGLIEIYETVLRRGISLTIDGTPPFDYGPANDALLLASGYLNDLYMALGNEAFADATNPIISLDAGTLNTIGGVATSRFAFQGQVPTLLDEELTLLRGRDDFLVPGATTAPVYNRFFWNYTRGIDAGEVIYALNYNIRERPGSASDGKVDAADAARQFPQGHGDAYGHYLTALSNYYRLLSDQHFTWTPRVEAVNILGVPVTVDYQDERKLALSAVSLGRTASRILDLERRKLPTGQDATWSALRDVRTNNSTQRTRTWGVEQWASRAAQGNFIHWAMVNSLLPENDLLHEGIQKIDRHSVSEIDELVSLGDEFQTQLDAANHRTNALNLTTDSVLFDISPTLLNATNASQQSHFEQILARAKVALANANTAYASTAQQNNMLRSVEIQANDYAYTVNSEERAYQTKLIELYGRPYAGDIGPGRLYPEGYVGPDYFNFLYIDRPYIYQPDFLFGTVPQNGQYVLPINLAAYNAAILKFDGKIDYANDLRKSYASTFSAPAPTKNLTYTYDRNAGPYQIAPATWGRRAQTGKIQLALSQVMNARENLTARLNSLSGRGNDAFIGSVENFAYAVDKFTEDVEYRTQVRFTTTGQKSASLLAEKLVSAKKLSLEIIGKKEKSITEIFEDSIKRLPTLSGPLTIDIAAPARSMFIALKQATNKNLEPFEETLRYATYFHKLGDDIAIFATDQTLTEFKWQADTRDAIKDLREKHLAIYNDIVALDEANKKFVEALGLYENALQDAIRIQNERETFRMRAAAIVQGARTRDVAFRAFRTESLEQYKTLFDQAARYVFLAAQAYDYETTQLGSTAGREFLAGIVATRALGVVGTGGEPAFGASQFGDPGLSSYLAKLQADWNAIKGRLGINNPDQYGTLFSLRRELFNLPYREDGTAEDDTAWQDRLRASYVADLRRDSDIATHALPASNPNNLPQPGFVITFSTDIETGNNFFGNELRAGDSAYSSASYTTKINSVGVAFKGYIGMSQNGSLQSPNALSATPYVYLIPAGIDKMRTPPLNGAPVSVREWLVRDHAIPLPYDIGGGGFGQDTVWNSSTVLSEPFFLPRKHQPFRAVSDASILSGRIPDEFTNRRLVGRSAWNTKWKLVIPADTLLADPVAGRERFIASVKDIKLYLRTYSHAGN